MQGERYGSQVLLKGRLAVARLCRAAGSAVCTMNGNRDGRVGMGAGIRKICGETPAASALGTYLGPTSNERLRKRRNILNQLLFIIRKKYRRT
jgi:hypothetical protein